MCDLKAYMNTIPRIHGEKVLLGKVREAQQEMIGDSAPIRVTLHTDKLPDSLRYLHGLIARGLGDSYNYYDGTFVINVNAVDRDRFPALKSVSSVMLQYKGTMAEEDVQQEEYQYSVRD